MFTLKHTKRRVTINSWPTVDSYLLKCGLNEVGWKHVSVQGHKYILKLDEYLSVFKELNAFIKIFLESITCTHKVSFIKTVLAAPQFVNENIKHNE